MISISIISLIYNIFYKYRDNINRFSNYLMLILLLIKYFVEI